MKKFITPCLLLFCSCKCTMLGRLFGRNPPFTPGPSFTVMKIDTIPKFFVIYTKNEDGYYKLITKRSDDYDCQGKIVVNGAYLFSLQSVVSLYNEKHGADPIEWPFGSYEPSLTPVVQPYPVLYIGGVHFQLDPTYRDIYFITNAKGLCYCED